MAFNTNEQQEAFRVGAQFKLAKAQGFLTDANVTAADTVAGLRSAVTAAPLPLGASAINRKQTDRAITAGVDLGFLTDGIILPLTTVDALIALSGIPAAYTARTFYD